MDKDKNDLNKPHFGPNIFNNNTVNFFEKNKEQIKSRNSELTNSPHIPKFGKLNLSQLIKKASNIEQNPSSERSNKDIPRKSEPFNSTSLIKRKNEESSPINPRIKKATTQRVGETDILTKNKSIEEKDNFELNNKDRISLNKSMNESQEFIIQDEGVTQTKTKLKTSKKTKFGSTPSDKKFTTKASVEVNEDIKGNTLNIYIRIKYNTQKIYT